MQWLGGGWGGAQPPPSFFLLFCGETESQAQKVHMVVDIGQTVKENMYNGFGAKNDMYNIGLSLLIEGEPI